MKAVMLTDGGIELKDIKLEALSLNWARIRIAKVGLCGSDVAKISDLTLPPWHTRILGHEFYGQVIELNGSSENISVGDWAMGMPVLFCGVCFACVHNQENLCAQAQAIGRTIQGAFAEYVDVPIANVIRVTDHSLFEPYVLADPLAVCVHASKLIDRLSSPQRCLVVGDGTIGCLLAWLLRNQGHEVLLKGIHQKALQFIEGIGIKTTTRESHHHNFDVVFEAVGRAQAHTLDESIKAVRWGGVVVVVGVFTHGYTYPLVARDLFIREVRLVGSNAYRRSEFKEAAHLIQLHHQTLSRFISHRVPLSQFGDAFALARKKQGFTMKIILETEGMSS